MLFQFVRNVEKILPGAKPMLKPNQSCPVLLTIGVDRETSGLLFAHQRSGGVDVISHLCKRCLKAVQRLVL